jgi:RNA polymerase sigma-70 factor (ECF subfamily)
MTHMDMPLETIWTAFGDSLKRFILSRVRDEQASEDILQDVFVKIHARIDTLNDERKLQSWVYQIARNAIVDYYRKSHTLTELSDGLSLPEKPADDEVTRRLSESVAAMVDLLPEEYRLPLVMDTFEGLSQQQIADRLGLSLSGAKSRVQRARAKLRGMLLDCCHFEFDRRGAVIDYRPRADCTCCADCQPDVLAQRRKDFLKN